MNESRLVAVSRLGDVTIRLGRFHREPVYVYTYEDGRVVIGYHLFYSGEGFVFVSLWPE